MKKLICLLIFNILLLNHLLAEEYKISDTTKFVRINVGKYMLEYSNKIEGYWHKIKIINNGKSLNVTNPFDSFEYGFEISDKDDVSKGGGYLRIHVISHGLVEGPDTSFYHDRYSCSIVQLNTGCIIKDLEPAYCGGEWDKTLEGVWDLQIENYKDKYYINRDNNWDYFKSEFKLVKSMVKGCFCTCIARDVL